MAIIRTVLGDKAPNEFEAILPHEHTVFHFLGAEADHRAVYDRVATVHKASEELRAIKERHGVSGIVDAAPFDLGRDTGFQVEVSRRSGVDIIAATGLFTESSGLPPYWRQRDIDALEEFFAKEITEGVVGTGVRCGVIKLATGPGFIAGPRRVIESGNGSITPSEERAFRAAAGVQRKLGVCIMTHTEPGDWSAANIGAEQLTILKAEGADPSRCIIGHVSTNANLSYIVELVRQGVNVAYDTIGLEWAFPDEFIAGMVIALVSMGYQSQLLLSQDRYCMEVRRPPTETDPLAFPSVDAGHLFRKFIPLLQKGGVGEHAVRQIVVENPRRILAF